MVVLTSATNWRMLKGIKTNLAIKRIFELYLHKTQIKWQTKQSK